MLNIEKDEKYYSIIDNIIRDKEFNKLNDIEHHGITRYKHSVRVSYYSYKICKLLKLDYVDAARAGLLHDFYLSDLDRNFKEKFTETFTHPKKAAEHAMQIYGINGREEDIIKSHMFPFCTSMPKYAESWIVNFVDKVIGSFEFGKKFEKQLVYSSNLLLLFLINMMK